MTNPLFCHIVRDKRKSTNDEISQEVIPNNGKEAVKIAKGTDEHVLFA